MGSSRCATAPPGELHAPSPVVCRCLPHTIHPRYLLHRHKVREGSAQRSGPCVRGQGALRGHAKQGGRGWKDTCSSGLMVAARRWRGIGCGAVHGQYMGAWPGGSKMRDCTHGAGQAAADGCRRGRARQGAWQATQRDTKGVGEMETHSSSGLRKWGGGGGDATGSRCCWASGSPTLTHTK